MSVILSLSVCGSSFLFLFLNFTIFCIVSAFYNVCVLLFKIIFYWLCYYSCPNFFPFASPLPSYPLPQAISTPIFMSMGHMCKLSGYSISYTVLHIPMVLCNYLFVLLNPLTSSPVLPYPLPSGNHQNTHCIHNSVSVLVCLVYFSDSIVDRYVFLPFHCL